MEFKHLRCKCDTRDGRICDAFLGNLEAHKPVTLQLPCHKNRTHKDRSLLTEFTQSDAGIITFRVVGRDESASYDDDNVRVQHGD